MGRRCWSLSSRRCRRRAKARFWSGWSPRALTARTCCSARGLYPPPPGAPDVLGLEIAGAVAALGPGATRFREGDQVLGLVPGGGYADYVVVLETNTLPVPAGLPAEEAGGIPETYFTVWTNVFERGRLRRGRRFWCMAARRASAPLRSSSPRPSGPA